MRGLLLVLICGCATSARTPAPADPANPEAPAGRVAPAPASLRAGVVSYPDVPVATPDAEPHPHHHHGS